MDNDELIKKAREMCDSIEIITPKQTAHDLLQAKDTISALVDALEASQKEISYEQILKSNYKSRAEKAESYICQVKKQLSNSMKERDTYRAALQNWHETTEGEY